MNADLGLPVMLTAAVSFVVVTTLAGLSLLWVRDPAARKVLGRTWATASVLIVLGVVVFWIATSMISGGKPVNRSLQDQQQNELQHRLQKGEH